MKDIVGLWPLGLIVLLLIIVLVWDWLDERKSNKEADFRKIWYNNRINHIVADLLPDEGLSPKEKQSFKK